MSKAKVVAVQDIHDTAVFGRAHALTGASTVPTFCSACEACLLLCVSCPRVYERSASRLCMPPTQCMREW